MMRTPKRRATYIATLGFLFAIQLLGHLLHNAAIDQRIAKSAGNPASPFIGSPLFLSAIESQILFFAVLMVLLAPSVIRHSGGVALSAWQSSRPFWSIAWSVVLVGLAAYAIYDAVRIYAAQGISIGNLVGSVALASIFLLARAEVVSSPNNQIQVTPKSGAPD